MNCPVCSSSDLNYTLIPESVLEYISGYEVGRMHLPEMRDYTCKNCSCTWMQPDEEPE